jgi:hypothetical protein
MVERAAITSEALGWRHLSSEGTMTTPPSSELASGGEVQDPDVILSGPPGAVHALAAPAAAINQARFKGVNGAPG